MLVKNDLYDYQNMYIYQDTNGFKFSLDSVLLAEYVCVKDNSIVLDMACGNMAIPLILSTKTKAKIIGFEIQKEVYELGLKSIELNKLDDRLTIINDDVNNIDKYFSSEYFDTIVVNPPYFKKGDTKVINNNEKLSIARHELFLSLEDIFKVAKKYLKNDKDLYIVHRVERLDEIINLGIKYHICVKNVQLIKTKNDKKPMLVLVKCVKNSNMGICFEEVLCIENMKTYKNIFEKR